MANKHVHAIYDDDDKLLSAVKILKSKGVNINDVFTPFPVHGLDHALDLKPTRIAIAAFIYGFIGFTFAIAAPYIFLENVLGFDITLGSLNSDTSITGLFYMYHFLPIVCNLVAGFVLLQYTLKRSQQEIIRYKLHSKNYD